jgi:hypothetical protein
MLNFNQRFDAKIICQHMAKDFASKKHTEAFSLQKWSQYQSILAREILHKIWFSSNNLLELNRVSVEWKHIRETLGKNRKGQYFLDWFQKHYPLVKIISRGYTGKLTMIETNFDLEVAAASQAPTECFIEVYKDYVNELQRSETEQGLVDWVPIDIRSLEAYLLANSAVKIYNQHHQKAIKINRLYAQTILQIAKHTGGFLPMIVSESHFGRKYYKGLNLQNCPKIVRHAALGNCHQYDIDTSVFAWKFNMGKTLSTDKFPATLEYITEKTARREQLANALDIPGSIEFRVSIIKELMTAVGFGSPASMSPKVAAAEIIKSPTARKNILSNAWFKEFLEEQKVIDDLIFNKFKQDAQGYDVSHLCDDKGQLKKNKVISFCYQHAERKLIDLLTESASEDDNLLFIIHDGFYTKRAVKIIELREKIKQINPYADISHEHHQAYGFNPFEEEHQQRMLDEELKANMWMRSRGFATKFTDEQIIRKNKFFNEQGTKQHDDGVRNGYFNGYSPESNYNFEDDPFF